MKNLEIISVTEVSIPFKDQLFDKKLSLAMKPIRDDQDVLTHEAYKNITYKTNMYVYRGLVHYQGHILPYITQSMEKIRGEHSINFLN